MAGDGDMDHQGKACMPALDAYVSPLNDTEQLRVQSAACALFHAFSNNFALLLLIFGATLARQIIKNGLLIYSFGYFKKLLALIAADKRDIMSPLRIAYSRGILNPKPF